MSPQPLVCANSSLFHDTPSAMLASIRKASLLALASPATTNAERQAVAETLADIDRELADRAMALVEADPLDLDLTRLAVENKRLRAALDERARSWVRPCRPSVGRRIVDLTPKGVRGA